MRKIVLLIFILCFTPDFALARNTGCRVIFNKKNEVLKTLLAELEPLDPMVVETKQMIDKIEALKIFGKSKRSRAKEQRHIMEDLEGLIPLMAAKRKNPLINEFLDKWMEFNRFWMRQIEAFEALPIKEQNELRPYLEAPISIATKHLISYLEARHHKNWEHDRLSEILTVHTHHPTASVRTSLFLMERTIKKYFSRWDFINCKY